MESVDCVVIGAGVVGLACAQALAAAGREVIILEQTSAFGTGISSRNSEVIHAGLYYPTGSLKARLCVEGKHLLYRWCEDHGVDYRRCGKLLVATRPAQVERLDAIEACAVANGVDDLQRLDRAAVAALEPALDAHAAVLSPSTGIVDSHGLMLSLLGDAEAHGAMMALNSPVLSGRSDGSGVILEIGGDAPMTLRADWVVNAAGLDAVPLARRIESVAATALPKAWFARGVYFTLSGKVPFSRLIYPMPEAGGLGVHLTLDLGGQAKFGPDVEWIGSPDFTVDPARVERFFEAIARWWPDVRIDRLSPGYAGVRPKLVGPGEPDADFRIDGPRQHGTPGLVNLLGIESPGLTASLAIGRYVAGCVSASGA